MENGIDAVPFFRRAKIEEPPTVLGKAMRSLDRQIKELQDFKVADLPNFRQKDPNTPMPRDQWRRIAMVYQGLIEPFSAAKGQRSDPVTITKACFEANQATLNKWDEQIKALTLTQLEVSNKTNIFLGYTQKDLSTIEKVFNSVVADYSKTGSIFRNAEGMYVARS